MAPAVSIVRTSVGNTASVTAAFARLGCDVRVTESPNEITDAPLLILPGVGAFGAAMASLESRDLVEPIRRRIESLRATLLICLGLQLLCDASDESPGVAGLGIVRGTVERFEMVQPVPQIGWNEVVPPSSSRFLKRGFAYYSNSYRLDVLEEPADWQVARTEFGQPFVAALERNNVLACQFHPELSGQWGLDLLRRWIASESVGAACSRRA